MSGIPKKITYRPIPFRMVMIKSGKRLRNDAAAGGGEEQEERQEENEEDKEEK